MIGGPATTVVVVSLEPTDPLDPGALDPGVVVAVVGGVTTGVVEDESWLDWSVPDDANSAACCAFKVATPSVGLING